MENNKTKKYQYLYLSCYIESKYLSLDTFSLREDYERIKFYSSWLSKINKKYIGVSNKNKKIIF